MTSDINRLDKVRRIFHHFDLNKDGCLNRDEMAALVVALNPKANFTSDQIVAMNDELFRTYAHCTHGVKGLTLDGLLRAYDDSAGDVDRDFDTLGLDRNTPIPGAPEIDIRMEKVKRIFHRFDMNRDGGLNREEQAALIVAVNPRVRFSDDQINAINKEVSRSYAEFMAGEKGLTLQGLAFTYDDGAGDVDRDFDALGLDLNTPAPLVAVSYDDPITESRNKQRAVLLNHTVLYLDTYKFLDDLDVLVEKLNKSKQSKDGKVNKNDRMLQSHKSDNGVSRDELGQNHIMVFARDLAGLWSRAERNCSRYEAFDRHMAIGRTLYNYHLYNEALISFGKALELQNTNVVARFRVGNCLYELGNLGKAKEEFLLALLEASKVDFTEWAFLLPQIHVNLGIVLEKEGMVLNACDHYREAVILCPTHFRALKRLGNALIVIGEYNAGIKALEEAIFLKKDDVDAHCDLGSALLAVGDKESAYEEFYKVEDLYPGHVDALYNKAEILADWGRYLNAFQTYNRLLVVSPNHWKGQLSKAVLLFGRNAVEEAREALKEGLKTANRVELHHRLGYLVQLQKRMLKVNGDSFGEGPYLIVEPSKLKTVEASATFRLQLANALHIRAFQKTTGLHRCDVELLKKQTNEYSVKDSDSVSIYAERSIRKTSLEGILRNLQSFLKHETFIASVKAINKGILSVMDESNSGKVDLGLFFAVLAPLCRGPLDRRKRVAYHALLSQPGNEGSSKIRKSDARRLIKLLRAIYIPYDDGHEMLEVEDNTDETMVSLTEFIAMFDDPDRGFGIMSTLLKLETGKRNGGYVCATCRSSIIGSRFKELGSHFSLCSHCYSEGKVPSNCEQEEYIFKEYGT